MFHVLLYYKLTRIDNPKKEVDLQKEVCRALQLKGRILINEDGINGTVGGSKESIALYRSYMDGHRVFKNIDFKESLSEIDPFPKLKVKYREEIITSEATEDGERVPLDGLRARHVNRDTFHEWLKKGEDLVLLDMRNDYEWEIGRFVGSVRPPMKYFSDLKDTLPVYDQFKDKKIVMFCTGGIRCEPASAMFLRYGFDPKQVYQLEGGIVKYAEKYGNEGFYEGKCFVFDERMAVPVNTSESAVVVGHCYYCSGLSDIYRNCANKWCNKLFLGCDACTETYENTCSTTCQQLILDENNVRPAHANDRRELHRNKI